MQPQCLERFVVCPLCDSEFTRIGNTLLCPNRHTFDLAREGYVNLEAARGRMPRTPGDTREMLAARRRFLARDFYRPLSDAINRLVCSHVAGLAGEDSGRPAGVLDAGCGEGYYLGRLKQQLDQESWRTVCCLGSDVSRDAIRLAARAHPGVAFVVASTTGRLPFRSIDVLLDVFAPRNPAEFRRITAPGALLLVVIPTERHLIEARRALDLLGIQEEKQRRVVERFAELFRLTHVQAIEYDTDLGHDDLKDLVLMGPSYWHQPAPLRERVAAVSRLRVTASFEILAFERLD